MTKNLSAATQRAVHALRRRSLESGEGEWLGTQVDLARSYDVCLTTFRLAAARVASEHLVTVKRGMRGGCYASRPQLSAVSQVAAAWVRSRKAPITDVLAAVPVLWAELAREAVLRRASECGPVEAEVLEFEGNPANATGTVHEFLIADRQILEALGRVAGSNVIPLLVGVTYDIYASECAGVAVVADPCRVSAYCKALRMVTEAVALGDLERCEIAARRCAEAVTDEMRRAAFVRVGGLGSADEVDGGAEGRRASVGSGDAGA